MLYTALMTLGATLAAPKALYQLLRHGKGQKSIKKRLFPKRLDFKRDLKKNLVWFHAVSVGEVNAIQSLANIFYEAGWQIVVSTITETGQQRAKNAIPFASCHTYLPLDFKCLVEPLVTCCQPNLVLISETDLWKNFIQACKNQGAKIAVVNGKLSERSFNLWKKFPFFSHPFFQKVDTFYVQNTIYEKRFMQLGINQNQIQVVGNLKYDAPLKILQDTCIHKFIDKKHPVIVFGSTHRGEEAIFLKAIKKMNVQAILAPRHPERFSEVEKLLKKEKISYSRLSHGCLKDAKVLLVDQMGLLMTCYSLADLAVVGGSFVSTVGGHNIVEPLFVGSPVIFGPFMHKQPQMVEEVLKGEAGLQVSEEKLISTFETLLSSKEELNKLKQRCEPLVASLKGATDRVWKNLEKQRLQ